jgi:DNA-binding beta-propeller fold protein YncE
MMSRKWLLVAGCAVMGALAGCGSSDECTGAACDAVADADLPPPPPPDAQDGDAEVPACVTWADPNACLASTCPDPATVSLELTPVVSINTDETANPEVLDFVKGSDSRAVVIAANSRQLSELIYTDTTLAFGRSVRLDVGDDSATTTSVKVAPSGEFAAVTTAFVDCGIGKILFVDVTDSNAFGTILSTVEVGYNPDSADFSPDGQYLAVANEDDRPARPCKPADRWGGSVSIIDLSAGPVAASVAQTILVNHAENSEPENIAVGGGNVAVVAVQETSEIGIFDLDDVPDATIEYVALPAGGNPDGMDISPDGRFVAIALEFTDDIVIFDTESKTILDNYDLPSSGDVPDEFNRDDRAAIRIYEPEQVTFATSQGALFVVFSLQESHSVIAYRVADDGSLTFDSIAPVGVNWMAEEGGRVASLIGPEGVAWKDTAGMVLVAQEREGSVTLLRTSQVDYTDCP